MRLTREIRPKYLLLENVDRLLKSPSKQRGRDFSIMLASFHEIGYSVEWRVINAAQYGFAQRRRRVFIFAIRNDTPYIDAHKKTRDSKMIEQEGFFAGAFPVKGGYKTKFKPKEFEFPTDLVYVSDHFSAHYYNAGIMRNGRVYTEELIPLEEAPITLGDIVESNVDEKYYLSENTIEKFRYLKGPKKIERTAASGHKYVFSEGGMAFPDPLDRPGRTMLTSEGTTNRSTHVVEDPETKQLRILTPVECERLNGFPDNWTKGMSERMRYFCMGNALVVGLIERMGKRILEIEEQDKIAIRNHPQQLSLF